MKTGRHEPNAQGFLGTILARTPSTRVSLVELSIDFGLMQTIQGPPEGSDPDAFAAWQVRFWRDMGYDCMSANLDIVFARHLRTAEDTAPLSHGTRSWAEESRGPITSWEEFGQYPWPQVSPAAFRTLETIKRHLPEGMKVMATLVGSQN